MFIVSTDRYTLYFNGWKPRIVKTWISGVETAILRGTDAQQVEELKIRLRYAGVRNAVTDPNWKPKQTRNRRKK